MKTETPEANRPRQGKIYLAIRITMTATFLMLLGKGTGIAIWLAAVKGAGAMPYGIAQSLAGAYSPRTSRAPPYG